MLALRPRLLPTAMIGATATLSSPSFLAASNPRLSTFHYPLLSNGIFRPNRLPLTTRFANASVRCFAAAATQKVRVQSPIVEMDGTSKIISNRMVFGCYC